MESFYDIKLITCPKNLTYAVTLFNILNVWRGYFGRAILIMMKQYKVLVVIKDIAKYLYKQL